MYDAEYKKILSVEKEKLTEKFQLDRSKFMSDKKIEKSRLFNDLRLAHMSKRFGLLDNLKIDIRAALQKKLQDKDEYKRLLKNLIV